MKNADRRVRATRPETGDYIGLLCRPLVSGNWYRRAIGRKRAPRKPIHTKQTYLQWFTGAFDGCSLFIECSTVNLRMQDHTETLRLGSRAPDFTLSAANREGRISLSVLLADGALILEFLRGTW